MNGSDPSSVCQQEELAHRPQPKTPSVRAAATAAPGTSTQVWVQLSSGMGSSVVAALATTPFDVVKTRMQVSNVHISTPQSQCMLPCLAGVDRSVLRACCILHPESGLVCVGVGGGVGGGSPAARLHVSRGDLHAPAQRANAYRTMMTIARTEGMPALWRGTGSNVVSCIPSVGIYLTTYEQLKARFVQQGVSLHLSPLLAGGAARAVSVIGTAPLELMRTRVMAQTGAESLGGAGVLIRAVTTHGWRSLWRGTAPTLYRDVPFSALYWVVAEVVRERLKLRWGAKRDALSVNLTAGFMAGACAAVTTHPFDVIKTRAQVEESPVLAIRGQRSPGTLSALRSLLANEGWAGLWGGVGPRVLKVGPSCAIVLGSYELFKSFLFA